MSAVPPPGGQPPRVVRPRPVAPRQPVHRPAPVDEPLTRPLWLDFILILAGCWLSFLLTDMSGFQAARTSDTPGFVGDFLLKWILHALFLPLGVILLWPAFWVTQWFADRPDPLSAGEWLWGVAWLGAVVLTGWIIWQYAAPTSLPEGMQSATFKGRVFVGYSLAMLALAAVALVIGVIDLFARWGQPWTHHCCLALLMWPVLPLAVVLLCNVSLTAYPPVPVPAPAP
ncbi:MAG: hypothetical protein IT429_17845 [Gemmataceae bacterium]|nr:hypothetical protein [Gemmataceae bacterium]